MYLTVTEDDGNGGTRTRTEYNYLDRQIMRIDINLGTVNSPNYGDLYRFPFKIELPSNIPSSMYIKGVGRAYCQINYKIKAKLLSGGKTLFGNKKVQVEFNVMSQYNQFQT